MPIKKNLLTIFTIIFLVITIGILFWYGNKKIKQAEQIESTVIAWENLDNISLSALEKNCSKKDTSSTIKALNFFIKNITSQKQTYTLTWLINNQEVDSQKIEISENKIKYISPTKQVINQLCNIVNNKNNKANILYQIKVDWGNQKQNSELIGKLITK